MIRHQFSTMENTKTLNIGETALSIIAIVLTMADLFYRGSVFLVKISISLLFQLVCVLLLAATFILAFLIIMTISTLTGPWLNAHLQ